MQLSKIGLVLPTLLMQAQPYSGYSAYCKGVRRVEVRGVELWC